MTDKQIIIDGVDVSGCGSYMDNGECISELVYSDYCKVCPNCTYKLEQKLKAKEQECEEKSWEIGNLGYKIKNQRKEINIRLEQLDKLKAENDKLTVRNIEYMNGNIGYQLKNSLYKQTLTEIKEIAKNGCYDDCGMPLDELSIILQKISECDIE